MRRNERYYTSNPKFLHSYESLMLLQKSSLRERYAPGHKGWFNSQSLSYSLSWTPTPDVWHLGYILLRTRVSITDQTPLPFLVFWCGTKHYRVLPLLIQTSITRLHSCTTERCPGSIKAHNFTKLLWNTAKCR